MSIRGVGTDIVATERIRAALGRHGRRFSDRILAAGERERYHRDVDPAAFLARRFAAKEAAAKALGTGIAAGVGFHDIHIGNDAAGRPTITWHGAARTRCAAMGAVCAHLSLSDERCYAVAFVVLEGEGGAVSGR